MNLDQQLGVVHHFPTTANAVYIRQMQAPAGYTIGSHKHEYEHYSILASGQVRAEVDGIETLHSAPCVMTIPAGKEHKITALSDIAWFCVHGTSETDESRIDDVLIVKE